ncbi:hypothetical protein C0989_003219 [Termitomyces sp. Mn162]|nr:hypothetical protein C0989_003219 [Termitomyces sp. Mn162]
MGLGVGTHEARHWHYRAYDLGELNCMSPAEVGHAAAYEAYRSWTTNPSMYEYGDIYRQRERLIGLAVGEAARLLAYVGQQTYKDARLTASETAAATASTIFYERVRSISAAELLYGCLWQPLRSGFESIRGLWKCFCSGSESSASSLRQIPDIAKTQASQSSSPTSLLKSTPELKPTSLPEPTSLFKPTPLPKPTSLLKPEPQTFKKCNAALLRESLSRQLPLSTLNSVSDAPQVVIYLHSF